MTSNDKYAAIKFMQQMLAFGEGEQHYRLAINALRRSQDHTAIQTKCSEYKAEIESLRSRLAEAEAENARLVAANKARDEFLRGHRYKHSEVDGYINLCESQIATLKARLADAEREARVLVVAMADQFGAPDNWKPLPDAAGMITQISNMVAGLREERALIVTRAENAEAALVEANETITGIPTLCRRYEARLAEADALLREARDKHWPFMATDGLARPHRRPPSEEGRMTGNKLMMPIGWCGFYSGEPYPVEVHDTYGQAVGFDVFKTRREARARYNDVRRVYFEIPVKAKP